MIFGRYTSNIGDRLLSMELGRMPMIDDADCDIGLPCPVDDHFIHEQGVMMRDPQSSSSLLTTIHVVRLLSPLLQSLKAPVISQATLKMFDGHFSSCMEAFPPYCHIGHPSSLEPRRLYPICYLQNARLILHRHNLSTSCSPEIRATALESCVSAARDTVTLLQRVMQWPPANEVQNQQTSNHYSTGPGLPDGNTPQSMTWQYALVASTTSFFCTHLWRCTLLLLYRGYYSEALTCMAASAVIGDARKVNDPCGRYLYGFLCMLNDKIANGQPVDDDEGILAIVSADAQGSTESSWIWAGSETGAALNSHHIDGERDAKRVKMEKEMAPTADRDTDWGGWANIEWMVQQMIIRRDGVRSGPIGGGSGPSSSQNGQNGSAALGGAARISIANII